MKYLLDSVILIDHFNEVLAASEFIDKHRDEIAISPITRAEVLTGFRSDSKQASIAVKFLNYFELLPISAAEADLAAKLRNSERWKLPDAFQAAIAKLNSLKLVTRNTKDFNPKNYSFVCVPYQL